jgi:hypothetical protein
VLPVAVCKLVMLLIGDGNASAPQHSQHGGVPFRRNCEEAHLLEQVGEGDDELQRIAMQTDRGSRPTQRQCS